MCEKCCGPTHPPIDPDGKFLKSCEFTRHVQNGRITVRRQRSLHSNDPSQSENGSSLSRCLAGLQLEPCAHLLGLVWFGLVWFGLVWFGLV